MAAKKPLVVSTGGVEQIQAGDTLDAVNVTSGADPGHTHSIYVPYTGATTGVNLGVRTFTTTGTVTTGHLTATSVTGNNLYAINGGISARCNAPNEFSITRYTNDVASGLWVSRKSRGTYASPIGVRGGDALLRFVVEGMLDTPAWPPRNPNADAFRVAAVGAWTTLNRGRNFTFLTIPEGSTTAITTLYLSDDGNVSLKGNNRSLFLGVNDNAAIYYDGADLVVNPKAVGVGLLELKGALTVAGSISASLNDVVSLSVERYGANAHCGYFLSKKSRGTEGVPVGINNGDSLLRHSVQGMQDTGAYVVLSDNSDVIRAEAVGAWTTTKHGRKLSFLVCPENSVNAIDALIMDDDANVLLPADNRSLRFGGGASGDAGIYYDGTDLVVNPKVIGTGGVKILGDLFFSGAGTGLPFAGIYGENLTDTITISGTGVANKVQVTSFAADGESNLATPDHTNDHITISKTGKYLVIASVTFESAGGAAYVMDFQVCKNNGATLISGLHTHRHVLGGGSDCNEMTVMNPVSLTAADTLELWCWNETNTADIIVGDVSLTAVMVGG